MNKLVKALFVAAVLSLMDPLHASAGYIVDTGTPTGDPTWEFDASQYFAGQFTVSRAQRINSIEAYFSSWMPGNVTFEILAGGGVDPGTVLFAAQTSIAAQTPLGWHGVIGLSDTLAAGTYWVAAMVDDGIYGVMPGTVSKPMIAYDQASGVNGWELASIKQDNPSFNFDFVKVGFRIDASPTSSVPEPVTVVLLGLGLVGLTAARRNRNFRAKETLN